MTVLSALEFKTGQRRQPYDHPVAKWTLGGRFFMADGSPYLGADLAAKETPVIEVKPARKRKPKRKATKRRR